MVCITALSADSRFFGRCVPRGIQEGMFKAGVEDLGGVVSGMCGHALLALPGQHFLTGPQVPIILRGAFFLFEKILRESQFIGDLSIKHKRAKVFS